MVKAWIMQAAGKLAVGYVVGQYGGSSGLVQVFYAFELAVV